MSGHNTAASFEKGVIWLKDEIEELEEDDKKIMAKKAGPVQSFMAVKGQSRYRMSSELKSMFIKKKQEKKK